MKKKLLIIGVLIIGIFAISFGIFFQFKEDNSGENNDKVDTTNNSTQNNQEDDENEVMVSISCDKSENSSSTIPTDITYGFDYKGDKLKKYIVIYRYIYTDTNKEEVSKYKNEDMYKLVELSQDVPGIYFSISNDIYELTSVKDYDLEVFDSKTYSDYSAIFPTYKLNDSITNIIKELEADGFVCE